MTRLYNNQQQQTKKNLQNYGLSEKKDKYRELARELKISVEYESDDYTNYNWCSLYSQQRIGKMTRRLGNKRRSGENQNCSIAEIGQNTEKSPGAVKDSSERPSANADVKNSQRIMMIIIIMDLARELKMLWNMIVIPTIEGTQETIHKGSEKRLEELDIRVQIEIVQNKALIRSARNLDLMIISRK